MKELTRRQKGIYDFIIDHIRWEGYPQTIRQIGQHFDIASPNGVKDHLLALQKKGHIRLHSRKSRGIEVLRREEISAAPERGIPLVGRIAAGEPILAVENIEDTLTFERMFPSDGRIFALKVKGDSMIEEGLNDGDIVVVRPQPTAEKGDIVVALLDDEATVKKFDRRGAKIYLHPANRNYQPIVRDEVEIAGRVIGVIRRIK